MTDAVRTPNSRAADLARARADLLDREARLRAILQTAAEGIITINGQGIIEQANPAAEKMFGYSVHEMVGQNVSILMPTPHREQHDGYLADYLKTGQPKILGASRELEGRRRDGTIIPIDISVSEVQLGDRRLFTGIIRDATERKRAESHAAGIGRIIEESLNEIYIIDAESLRFIQVNRGARENLGYSLDELRQITPIEIKPEYTAKSFTRLIEPLTSGQQKTVVFTTVHRRKDGSQYDVEVHLQRTEYEGRPVLAAIILDITERRAAEEALRREHEFARSIVETAQAIVLVLDVSGRIVQFNPFMETLCGYRLDEVRGKDWFETFLPKCDHGRIRDIFLQSLQDVRTRGNVNSIVTRDGTQRDIAWWDETLKDADGYVTGILAIGHDVTELNAAQRTALQTERLAAIGEMAAGLAHESRNALQRSQACLEMLEVEVEDRAEALDLVHRIQSAQDHLHRLYEEVREYAAPINLDRQSSDVGRVWRDTWSHLKAAHAVNNVNLTEEINGVDLQCKVDPFALGQVFRNILENAVAACPDNAEILIRCEKSRLNGRPALMVSILDSGPGLSSDQRRRIFDPFFTTKTKGTGLGMAIASRIVHAHEGRIAVGSDSTCGTEIVLTLPRALA